MGDLGRTVRGLVAGGTIRVRWHARLDEPPPPLPAGLDIADKVEGMLLGLAIGDALGNTSESMDPSDRRHRHGWIRTYLPNRRAHRRAVGLPSDDSQLAFWTLEHLLQCGGLDPRRLGGLFAAREEAIFGGGETTRQALQQFRSHGDWTRSGRSRASNGALMRIAPVLLPHLARPSALLWTDTLAAAHLTHDDELSNSSCIALVDLLWRLIGAARAPDQAWWLAHWIEVNAAVGSSARYAARNAHPPGFDGTINELLTTHVRPALAHDLAVEEAGEIWHSGAYLLETVPSVVYILSRHGHDPRTAIEQAVNGTRDNDTVAAIVGAAVGALHGARALPDEWVEALLGRTSHHDDGQVFRLLQTAGQTFGYGVGDTLRRRMAGTRAAPGGFG